MLRQVTTGKWQRTHSGTHTGTMVALLLLLLLECLVWARVLRVWTSNKMCIVLRGRCVCQRLWSCGRFSLLCSVRGACCVAAPTRACALFQILFGCFQFMCRRLLFSGDLITFTSSWEDFAWCPFPNGDTQRCACARLNNWQRRFSAFFSS